MPERYRTRKLAAPLRRALDVAAAIATEEVLAAHVAQTLELIEISEARVAPQRVADIYLRLHNLEEPTASVVRTRILAEIGQRARNAPAPEPMLVDDSQEEVPARGPFRSLRERFRGRVHHELRRWMELHTGRTEVVLLDIHVRNALVFVQTLAPDVPIQEAVAIYRERVNAPEHLGQVLYWFVLARLSDAELPNRSEIENPELRIPAAARKVSRRNGSVRSPYRTI